MIYAPRIDTKYYTFVRYVRAYILLNWFFLSFASSFFFRRRRRIYTLTIDTSKHDRSL